MVSNCLLHFNKSRIAFENNTMISQQRIQGIMSVGVNLYFHITTKMSTYVTISCHVHSSLPQIIAQQKVWNLFYLILFWHPFQGNTLKVKASEHKVFVYSYIKSLREWNWHSRLDSAVVSFICSYSNWINVCLSLF